MSREARRTLDYLNHILDAIARIQAYTEDTTAAAFSHNTLVQDAVIRNLEIVGEACRNVERHDPAFAAAHPELPLAVAYEMRNALSHGYFSVDLDLVWSTIHRDLPGLETQIRSLVADLNKSDGS